MDSTLWAAIIAGIIAIAGILVSFIQWRISRKDQKNLQVKEVKEPLAAELILTPINESGSNIFSEVKSEDYYFVQLRFHIQSTREAEILDINFDYSDAPYPPVYQHILLDGEEVKRDIYGKLKNRIHLRKGLSKLVSMVQRFPRNRYIGDYGNVRVFIEVNFLHLPKTTHKEWQFKLSSGGALLPTTQPKG